MHKILIFDLDGTLALLGEGMYRENILKLRDIEKMGYRIALCSGKPVAYLCGFARQIGLREPILIGENGASTQYGIVSPPTRYWDHPHTPAASRQISEVRRIIDERCQGKVWYQPNTVCLTPYPQSPEVFDIIQQIIDEDSARISELVTYRHVDCFDFVPANISKQSGIAGLARAEGCTAADLVAFGDAVNDIPMFEFADISVGIGGSVNYPTTLSFDTIGEALDFVMEKRI